MSRQGLENILKKIDFNKIKNLNINGYATCTSISEIRVKYFKFNGNSTEDIKNILYATSAVPLIYDSAIINNVSYLDGGIVDNTKILKHHLIKMKFLLIHFFENYSLDSNIQLVPLF